jgi:Domain of unknown function (DUF397)
MHWENGISAERLTTARWRKSTASNPSGSCVEIAELSEGMIAIRNSRDKSGPALIYPRTELAGFLRSVKDGEFDSLLTCPVTVHRDGPVPARQRRGHRRGTACRDVPGSV